MTKYCNIINPRTIPSVLLVSAILSIISIALYLDVYTPTFTRSYDGVFIPWKKTQLSNVSDSIVTNENIYFTIKTTKKFHSSRIQLMIKTWFKKARNVFVITDDVDPLYSAKLGNRLVATKCGASHSLEPLCCKTGAEYNTVVDYQTMKWWCHFDDDNYVNVENLVKHLNKFDWTIPAYVGRRSRENIGSTYKGKDVWFQFSTGGAGACISKPLAHKMQPWIRGNELPKTCWAVYAEDDVTVGFIITSLLQVPLNESFLFHSHMEQLKDIPENTLRQQVCLSYKGENMITLSPENSKFSVEEDPTRMMSLHCLNYPNDELCV